MQNTLIVTELFSEKALFNKLVQPTRQKKFDSWFWYLLFKIRYYVVPNCGTANEINGALYHDIALSLETRLKQKLTSYLLFFHWSAPNPSGKMVIMYLPTIWVSTWYDSMSCDCHMTIFSSKSSLLCRFWHVSNPAETRVKVLFRLFILCANREIMYFRITLKKKHLDA